MGLATTLSKISRIIEKQASGWNVFYKNRKNWKSPAARYRSIGEQTFPALTKHAFRLAALHKFCSSMRGKLQTSKLVHPVAQEILDAEDEASRILKDLEEARTACRHPRA